MVPAAYNNHKTNNQPVQWKSYLHGSPRRQQQLTRIDFHELRLQEWQQLQQLQLQLQIHLITVLLLQQHHLQLFLLRASRSCSWVQNPSVSYLLRRTKLNLWTLQHHDLFFGSESRNRRKKIKLSNKGGGTEAKGAKGCVDIHYFWSRAGNMPAFDDETFGDEAFGDENFRWRSFRWWNFRWRGVRWSVRKNVESLLGQFVY